MLKSRSEALFSWACLATLKNNSLAASNNTTRIWASIGSARSDSSVATVIPCFFAHPANKPFYCCVQIGRSSDRPDTPVTFGPIAGIEGACSSMLIQDDIASAREGGGKYWGQVGRVGQTDPRSAWVSWIRLQAASNRRRFPPLIGLSFGLQVHLQRISVLPSSDNISAQSGSASPRSYSSTAALCAPAAGGLPRLAPAPLARRRGTHFSLAGARRRVRPIPHFRGGGRRHRAKGRSQRWDLLLRPLWRGHANPERLRSARPGRGGLRLHPAHRRL